MNLNQRQKDILETIINDYIETGLPVSSLQLNQKYDLGVCSATIRNDMFVLTENNYLHKSYSSSGRVPTSKGYRFFIEGWQDKESFNFDKIHQRLNDLEPIESGDIFSFSNDLLKELTNFSSGLLLNYVFDRNILWEEGWENVILEPELKTGHLLDDFVGLVEETKEKLPEITMRHPINDIEIFIGKENPIMKTDDFSIITCRSKFPKTKQGCAFVLLGPKRMPYRQNLELFKSLLNFLEKL